MRLRPTTTRAPGSASPRRVRARLRSSFRHALGASVVAGAAATVTALLVRLLTGLPTPAELFGDRITVLIPLPLFSALLRIFGTDAKHVYFAALVVGEFTLSALFGVLYDTARAGIVRQPLASGATSTEAPPFLWESAPLAILPWLLSAGVLAPVIGAGFFGAGLPGGAGGVLRAQAAPNLVFALAYIASLRRQMRAAQAAAPSQWRALTRRRLLRQASVSVAVLGGGVLLWEAISAGLGSLAGIAGRHRPQLSLSSSPSRITPPPTPNYGDIAQISGLTPEITPTKDFYYVSKNLVSDPSIDVTQWGLKVDGLVSQPYSLTYDDLRALPAISQYHTLECISNDIGGNLMSNALFVGTRLADVLNHAGIQAGASQVVFRASDGYSDSLHLSQALHPDALIAYEINGLALPQAHGYPARLLIPGLYGMKNGKWLTSLSVVAGTYDGYWEQRGWTREAAVKMMARIDTPHDGDVLPARGTAIAGVAYAGSAGVSQVDVSVDGGQSWRRATLRRPLGTLTWVLWELPWTPTPGNHIIVARAIDAQGNVQSPTEAPPLPDGASGYDAVSIVAR